METKSAGVETVDELKNRSRRDAESHFWAVEKFFIIVLVATASLQLIDGASKAGQGLWLILVFAAAALSLIVYGLWCWSAVVGSQEAGDFYLDVAQKCGIPRRITFRVQQGFWFISASLVTIVIAGSSFVGDSQLDEVMKMQKENSAKIDRLMERVEGK
jgi:hypothetical protein